MKEKKERRKRRAQSKFSCLILSTVRRINETLEKYFTLEQLKVFIYNHFASLGCVYLGVAPIP